MNMQRTMQRWFWHALVAAGFGVLALFGWMMHTQDSRAALDVPQVLVYQGRLTDDERITVDDGSYNMTFAIYDAASGGTCLWSAGDGDATASTIECTGDTPDNSVSVTVTDGIFTILLGDTTASQNALPDELFDDNGTSLYLGVAIGADAEMSPRRRIGASAFALQAGDADLLDDLDTDNDGCTSACVPVTDNNGNIVFTGSPQGSGTSDGVVFINPASPSADETLFAIGNGSGEAFRVDTEGDVKINSHAAIGRASSISANDVLVVLEDFDSVGTYRLQNNVAYIDGAFNAGGIYVGGRTHLVVDGGVANDVQSAIGLKTELDHDGGGTSDVMVGNDLDVIGSAGTVTTAWGIDAQITTDDVSATISNAYAVQGSAVAGSGTMTTAYGGHFKAEGATTNYALYTAEGRVQIDGDSFAATPNDATTDGTLFVAGVIETDTAVYIDGTYAYAAGRNGEAGLHIESSGFSGTHADEDDAGSFMSLTSTGTGSGGTYAFIGEKRELTYSGAGTSTDVYGSDTIVYVEGNVSGASYGQYADVATRSSASGVTSYGLYGRAGNTTAPSTTTAAYGVYGEAYETAGTLTTGYGGYFKSTDAGTNYALYTAEGRVQIEGDATATTPSTASSDGSLFVVDDIETDADLDVGGHLALVGATPSSTAIIDFTETWSSASAHTAINGALTIESAQEHAGLSLELTVDGSLNSGGRISGSDIQLNVDPDDGSAHDAESLTIYRGVTNHDGTGITDQWNGLLLSLDIEDAATITEGTGVSHSVALTDGTVTTAMGGSADIDSFNGTLGTVYGWRADIGDTGTGSITGNAYGLYADVDGASGQDYALYTAQGYVHVEGDGSATTPTFNGVGGDGTVFIHDDVEIYDGSLCVGDGAADNCSDAAGTDGVIYAVNTSVTAHDLAEMFPSRQFLTAGEIVSVSADSNEHIERTIGDDIIIGAISTTPGLTLGWETEEDGFYPVALTGRTPVKVNDEGGAIAIGDRIAQSSVDGVGKKADGPGEVVGIAMQAFDGHGNGAVMTFIQPHYWNGVDLDSVTEDQPEPEVDPTAAFVVDGNQMRNIAYLEGYNWNISMDGVFTTDGAYRVEIRGNNRRDTVTYSTLSSQQYITLAGTTKITGRKADIDFGRLDPEFANVIEHGTPIMVTATMSNGSGQVYVREKSTNGFEIWREGGSGDEVDWIVYAYRKGTAPEEPVSEEEEEVPVADVAEDTEEASVEEPLEELETADPAEDVVNESAAEVAADEALPHEDVVASEEGAAETSSDTDAEEEIVETTTEVEEVLSDTEEEDVDSEVSAAQESQDTEVSVEAPPEEVSEETVE